jgi:Zn-dependent protease
MRAVLQWFLPFLSGLSLGVLAMVLHECGHLVAAGACGVQVKRVGFQWNRGLYTRRERGSARENLLIALAGPFTNFILLATAPWFPMFSLANFCYALANMLPTEGSDGFRVAACWREIRESKTSNASVFGAKQLDIGQDDSAACDGPHRSLR